MSTKDWLDKDYYKVLGVSKEATGKEIKLAFRKLAQQYHPDANKDNPAAEAKFKEISEAYGIVGDAKTRKEYDEARSLFGSGGFRFRAGSGGAQAGPEVNISDLLGGLFSGGGFSQGGFGQGGFGQAQDFRFPRAGADAETHATISFTDALNGVALSVPGVAGTVQTRIPAGVKDGQRIRLKGKGHPGGDGGPPGDLFVVVKVTPHRIFGRKGKSITLDAPVSFVEAALGAEIEVPTLDGGKVRLRIPAGTQHGQTFRVRGRENVPDMLVSVAVQVPKQLSSQAKQALAEYSKTENGDLRAELFEQE